ncbi:FitA-like ribbon-helix-helix domain-containing protein [Ralstonia pseudosolanacearum]|uniref:FitA-like ribbon-helix-helix domain-containing protein n=1 Tax=Ralstonia pseudosolanacearum TaxID=1310165 RepID=UPI003D05E420
MHFDIISIRLQRIDINVSHAMLGKIAIRSIPADIWAGLEALATRHYRSTEAEARYALRAWVEPLLQQKERSARRTQVASRLRDLLDQVNTAHGARGIRPSHIAQAIGEDYAEPVENWFVGELEPTFRQLESVAEYLGGSTAWLQHGDGAMFTVKTRRIPEDAAEGTKWLLDLNEAGERTNFLHLVRQGGATGALAIVKQYGDWRCKTYSTPYHISEAIGAGGESSLVHLTLILRLLYKYYTRRSGDGVVIKSYILREEEYRALLDGNAHPLPLLSAGIETPWWEDIWDENQWDSANYWEGWKTLCPRIRKALELRPTLVEELKLIKAEEHPLLTESRAKRPG